MPLPTKRRPYDDIEDEDKKVFKKGKK